MTRHFTALIACATLLASASAARADSLRWPEQPKPPFTMAVMQRAPAVAAYLTPVADRATARCQAGQICVICLAGCDQRAPQLIHSMTPRSTANKSTANAPAADDAENDTDGVSDNAPRFARQEWAGIVCGSEGGCRGAGVPPPRPTELYITLHRRQD